MNKAFDRYTSVIFLAIGIAISIHSQSLTTNAFQETVGPNVFPFLIGIILSILSIVNYYHTFRVKQEKTNTVKLDYRKFFIMLAASVLYAILLEPLGYVISTALFLLVGFQTMEKRGLWKSVVLSFAISIGVFFVFVEMMNGTLPGFPTWLGF